MGSLLSASFGQTSSLRVAKKSFCRRNGFGSCGSFRSFAQAVRQQNLPVTGAFRNLSSFLLEFEQHSTLVLDGLECEPCRLHGQWQNDRGHQGWQKLEDVHRDAVFSCAFVVFPFSDRGFEIHDACHNREVQFWQRGKLVLLSIHDISQQLFWMDLASGFDLAELLEPSLGFV